jgi:hypothetical protein
MCYGSRPIQSTGTAYVVSNNKNMKDGTPRLFCCSECLSTFYSDNRLNSVKYGKHMHALSDAFSKRNAGGRPFSARGYLTKHVRHKKLKDDMLVRQEVSLGDVAEIIDGTNRDVDTNETKTNHEVDTIEIDATKTNEVDEMKVYEGKVKDGKIEVAEPDGTKAVLIFDSVVAEQGKLVYNPNVAEKVVMEKPTNEPVVEKVPKSLIGRKNRNVLYREVLGCGLLEYFRKLKASGFNDYRRDAFVIMRDKFAARGYAHLFDTDEKMVASIRSVMSSVGFKCDKPEIAAGLARVRQAPDSSVKNVILHPVPVPVAPKVYQASKLLIDGPTDIPTKDLWPKILGTGIGAYLDRSLESGVGIETICDIICKEIISHGYKPNKEIIMSELYIKKGMMCRRVNSNRN